MIALGLVILSLSRSASMMIDDDKKSFVRYSDEGLFKATLSAFSNEWDKTFVEGTRISNLILNLSLITVTIIF